MYVCMDVTHWHWMSYHHPQWATDLTRHHHTWRAGNPSRQCGSNGDTQHGGWRDQACKTTLLLIPKSKLFPRNWNWFPIHAWNLCCRNSLNFQIPTGSCLQILAPSEPLISINYCSLQKKKSLMSHMCWPKKSADHSVSPQKSGLCNNHPARDCGHILPSAGPCITKFQAAVNCFSRTRHRMPCSQRSLLDSWRDGSTIWLWTWKC